MSVLPENFTLPLAASLRRWLSTLERRPGFAPIIFDLLMDRVSVMKEIDKFCVVSSDEMRILVGLPYNITADAVEGFQDFETIAKTPGAAKHALVFMDRGVTGKWK